MESSDADKQYSCAYFETPGATLDDAHLAKKRHVTAIQLTRRQGVVPIRRRGCARWKAAASRS